MTQARFYEVNGLSVAELAGAGADFFRRDTFDATVYNDYYGRTVLQIGKQSGGRMLVGMNYALTVVFTSQPDGKILIELGGESWADKIGSGAIGAFIFPPLLVTAAIGAWQQGDLSNQFWVFLDGYVFQRSGQPARSIMAVPQYNTGWEQQSSPGQWPPSGGYQTNQNSAYSYAQPGINPSVPTYPTPTKSSHRTSWFDPTSLQPIFEAQVGRMASWQAVMADGVINYDELNAQQAQVDKLQKQAEEMLETDAKIKLAEVLTELGKLEQIQRTALTKGR